MAPRDHRLEPLELGRLDTQRSGGELDAADLLAQRKAEAAVADFDLAMQGLAAGLSRALDVVSGSTRRREL